MGQRRNAFVEADRRAQGFLQHGMAHQIVGPQGLLDHGEHEIFQPIEHFGVAQRQAPFAVDVDRQRGKFLADEIDHLHVPAGAELEFHAGEARLGRRGEPRGKLVDRGHPVEGRPDLDLWHGGKGDSPHLWRSPLRAVPANGDCPLFRRR